MSKHIAWFKDLDADSLPVAGGKGTNLGIMYKLGFPVPNGFCVTAQTYQEYIETTGVKEQLQRLLQGLDKEDTDTLQQIATKIQDLIISTPIPDNVAEEIMDNYELLGADQHKASDIIHAKDVFVAVRSSATAEDLPEASFAGQQATYLNVKGKEKVVLAVLACWASLFTARAIYYREKNHFDHLKVYICAVVQRMVDADKSGIMFTINPATNSFNEIVIEAIYGLGELIVGGEINPDMYTVEKSSREIKKIEVRKKQFGLFKNESGENEKQEIPADEQSRQVLSDAQIKELARLGKKLEEHYEKPQDVEWAVERERLYLVQTRAVTTFKAGMAQQATTKVSEEEGKILLKGETASGGVYAGPVRIVSDPSELSKVQKGDILVTAMTTPDMVPAMQRAGAIITD